MTTPVKVAVLGAGYWGRNHVRTFAQEATAELVAVCDPDSGARDRAAQLAPDAALFDSPDAVLADRDIEAVVIATPAPSHAPLALRAIAAGKHVLVEKPLALSAEDASAIAAAATEAGVIVSVGHLLVYHPAVVHLRELLTAGELGDLFYLYASRVNLGKLRYDENALWSFGPHDLSVIDYLIGELPVSVSARGQGYLQAHIEDVVFVTMRFATGQMAHIHLSWLDPRKERRLTVVCSKKMAVFDDVASEKLRIYDKGYDRPPEFSHFDEFLTIRQGDVHVPDVPMAEPLALECRDFLSCVRTGQTPTSGVTSAVRVVKILSAAARSLELDGAPVALAPENK